MAENKKSFLFYVDWNETFKALPNEKAGELIKHLLSYVNDEDPQTEDILIKAVFANIKNTLKRDLEKWDVIKGKRSEAGKKSAQVKKDKKKQTPTKSTSVESAQQTPTKSTVRDTVTVIVKDRVIVDNKLSFIKEVLNNEGVKISVEKNLRNNKLTIPDYKSAVNMFVDKLEAEDDIYKSAPELRKHFNNWLKIEIKNLTMGKKDPMNGLTNGDFDDNGNLI